jgi:hypothetical protein
MKDKRARLRVAARYIKNGNVKSPSKGCEELFTQLLGFGAEKHGDAVDALVYLILGVAGIASNNRRYVMCNEPRAFRGRFSTELTTRPAVAALGPRANMLSIPKWHGKPTGGPVQKPVHQ